MIARLIAWSARNLVLVFVGAAFAVAAGVYALRTLPLDAIQDLSRRSGHRLHRVLPGQAPQVIEDQVTYPLTTSMLTVPKARVVRGFSFFGVSSVYVIFGVGTDPSGRAARISNISTRQRAVCPPGVARHGPDATGVGWVYQYAVMAKDMTLAELRSLQDCEIRFAACTCRGCGRGRQRRRLRCKQYAIVVDPVRLRAQGALAGGAARGRPQQQ